MKIDLEQTIASTDSGLLKLFILKGRFQLCNLAFLKTKTISLCMKFAILRHLSSLQRWAMRKRMKFCPSPNCAPCNALFWPHLNFSAEDCVNTGEQRRRCTKLFFLLPFLYFPFFPSVKQSSAQQKLKSHSYDDISQKGLSVLNLLVFLHLNLLQFSLSTLSTKVMHSKMCSQFRGQSNSTSHQTHYWRKHLFRFVLRMTKQIKRHLVSLLGSLKISSKKSYVQSPLYVRLLDSRVI